MKRDDLRRDLTRKQSISTRAAEHMADQRLDIAGNLQACDQTRDDYSLTDVDSIVDHVLQVNHDLEASEASWKAAMELYPQAVSWADPNFRFQHGPTIFGPAQGAHLWRMQFYQEVPWLGKTGIRGEIADRKADVAHFRWRQTRQTLIAQTRKSCIELARADQLYQLYERDYQLAKGLLKPPETIAQASFQLESLESADAYEMEILQLEQKLADYEAARRRSQEQLNILLHRDLESPLPVPDLPSADLVIDAQQMEQRAIRRSPQMEIARRERKQAELEKQLAEKEFYPDIKVVGRFDTNASSIWAPERVNMRPQMGIYLDPPLRQSRRWAKLREKEHRRRQRDAEIASMDKTIRSDVRRKIADLERSNERIARLDRVIASAERRAATVETLVSFNKSSVSNQIAAERAVLKYQMQKVEEQSSRLLHMNDLAAITGMYAWSGVDPLDEAGTWGSSLQFLPDASNQFIDQIRSFQSSGSREGTVPK